VWLPVLLCVWHELCERVSFWLLSVTLLSLGLKFTNVRNVIAIAKYKWSTCLYEDDYI
jgi:hypothetical protein